MNAFAAFFFLISFSTAYEVGLQDGLPTDYASAYKRAQAGDKPLLVIVTAQWCAPCQMLKRTTVPDLMARHGFKDFHLAMVDVDQEPELAAKLTEGRAIPELIVFERKDGSWQRRYSIGYMTVEQTQAFLSPSINLAVRLAKNPEPLPSQDKVESR